MRNFRCELLFTRLENYRNIIKVSKKYKNIIKTVEKIKLMILFEYCIYFTSADILLTLILFQYFISNYFIENQSVKNVNK